MEIHVIDRTQDASSQASARRRLIRGVFATPVVLTLCSGRALAQTSSALRCIAQANSGQVETPTVPETTDAWVRVQLVQSVANSGKYYVLGSRLPSPRADLLPTSTQWQEFNIGPNKLKDSPEGAPDVSAYSDVALYAALRINQDGAVVDVGDSNDLPGVAIGTSCWTSFITAG